MTLFPSLKGYFAQQQHSTAQDPYSEYLRSTDTIREFGFSALTPSGDWRPGAIPLWALPHSLSGVKCLQEDLRQTCFLPKVTQVYTCV